MHPVPALRSGLYPLRVRHERRRARVRPPLPPQHARTLRPASTGPDIPHTPIDPAPARRYCSAWLRFCSTHACSSRVRQGPNRGAALRVSFVSPPSSGSSPADPPSHPRTALDSIYTQAANSHPPHVRPTCPPSRCPPARYMSESQPLSANFPRWPSWCTVVVMARVLSTLPPWHDGAPPPPRVD